MNYQDEIIDDFTISSPKNKNGILKYFYLIVVSFILLLLLITFEKHFNTEYWKVNKEPSDITMIIILITFLATPILASKYLNEYNPRATILKINFLSGLNLFIVVMLFMLFSNIIIYGKRGGDLPISIVSLPFKMSILGLAISNISIHAFRKQKLIKPIIVSILIGIATIWILF